MNDSTVDLSSSLTEILQQKAVYLKQKIETYQLELASINNILSGNYASSEPNKANQHAKLFSIKDTYSESDSSDFQIVSQTVIRPYIIEFFKTNSGKAKTTEIYDFITNVKGVQTTPRRAWVTAISLCLNSLTKTQNPKVRKTETDNGNVMQYEWIGDNVFFK